ncbi:bifunctional DNA-formamidopyrimidine glycosylase/DNA-(apurinic or apyrimidinic site) lyase [Patescibacteria group bacterium]|nr:bifunctional DNA-formamidopyrimidine glycosylase/DNA-(apurinic or apyrimidinic site) lyase [Patescibacteria group bacterium]
MPELPEIETIKLSLQKKIIGLKIQKIQILSPKSFIGNPNLASGQKILKIWRKGKLLGVDLAGQSTANRLPTTAESGRRKTEDGRQLILLFHLKMTGQIIWQGESGKGEGERFIGGHPTEDMLGKMPNTHTRVIFSFSDPLRPRSEASGSHLYFNDQRRFGWIKVTRSVILSEAKDLKNLGPEPLEKEFTWQILKQNLLRHKSMSVKAAIMDQSVVSGVGNIYSNEAMFNAKLDPRRKVSSLTDIEFKNVYKGIKKALETGIKHGGSTLAHFVDPEGRKGYFLDYAKVYGLDHHSCKVCGTEIKKISLAGRGTYFCPNCQK